MPDGPHASVCPDAWARLEGPEVRGHLWGPRRRRGLVGGHLHSSWSCGMKGGREREGGKEGSSATISPFLYISCFHHYIPPPPSPQSPQVTPVSHLNSLARIQAQCAAQPGLSAVLGSLLQQQTGLPEFYIHVGGNRNGTRTAMEDLYPRRGSGRVVCVRFNAGRCGFSYWASSSDGFFSGAANVCDCRPPLSLSLSLMGCTQVAPVPPPPSPTCAVFLPFTRLAAILWSTSILFSPSRR